MFNLCASGSPQVRFYRQDHQLQHRQTFASQFGNKLIGAFEVYTPVH